MVDGLDLSLSSLTPFTVNLIAPPPPPPPPPRVLADGGAGNQSWSPRDQKKFVKALYDFGTIHTDNFYQNLAARIPGKTVTQVQQYFERYLLEIEVHALKTRKNSCHCVRVVTQNEQTETGRRKRRITAKVVKNHPKSRGSTSNAKVAIMEVAPAPPAKPRMLNLFPAPPSDHVEEEEDYQLPVTLNLFPLVPSTINEEP